MSIKYSTHIQDIGWQDYVYDGEVSGTTELSKRMEAIKIELENVSDNHVGYRVHVQNIGWQDQVWDGAVAGTTGQELRIEAISISLNGEMSEQYDIYYQCHVQNIGWMGWSKNGEPAGTTGHAYRLEAIKIVIVNKNDTAPGDTADSFRENPPIIYNCHVQDIGWQMRSSFNGEIAGTIGLDKRIEAFKITYYGDDDSGLHLMSISPIQGDIEYCAYVQNIGWQDFVAGGQVAGTTGQSLRVEAIKIRLTGDVAAQYDVYYQCYVQNIGWMGWAKNGEPAGTTGYEYRVEAIKVQLVAKSGSAPGSADDSFREYTNPVFRFPVNYIRITGGYVPSDDYDTSHFGIDFGDWVSNPPVFSAIPGIVDEVRNTAPDSAGKYVKIRYDDALNNCTWYTYHKHLDSTSVYVGQPISIGDQVGIMGGTGGFPVHLHFDLAQVGLGQGYNNGDFNQRKNYSVNPLNYLYKYTEQVVSPDTMNTYPILIL